MDNCLDKTLIEVIKTNRQRVYFKRQTDNHFDRM